MVFVLELFGFLWSTSLSPRDGLYSRDAYRGQSEGMLEYLARKKTLFIELDREKCVLPQDAKGYLLLKHANLSEKQCLNGVKRRSTGLLYPPYIPLLKGLPRGGFPNVGLGGRSSPGKTPKGRLRGLIRRHRLSPRAASTNARDGAMRES